MSKEYKVAPQDEAFARYLGQIRQESMLTPEEERALGQAVVNGGPGARRARDRLVSSHLRLVIKIARKFGGTGLPFEDLVQEGNVGLINAAERFDPGKGRFATYAWWWIRQAIRQYAIDNGRTIRIPTTRVREIQKLNATIKELSASGGTPTAEQVAASMGVDLETVHDLLLFSREPVSLNTNIGDGDTELGELVADVNAVDPEEAAIRANLVEVLRGVVETLPEREKHVLTLRFGLDGEGERTLEEVSHVYGVSRERIRQIEAKALGRIRDGSTGGRLKSA
ncbi:MAG: RNA polymerase sigma factor RpoD/SigA [Candidatus Melainabacteria bacterium]|nr:RNA polymerase sigma factor RpoD/SigA [Candidatus Melainabacteria bacterium]